MSARNRELLALIPASLLVTAGFAAVFIQRERPSSSRPVADLRRDLPRALPRRAHRACAFTLPHADPYLFPLVAVLACFGLVMLYRIDEDLAREQAQWFVVGLIALHATIVAAARLPRARALPLHRSRSAASLLLLAAAPAGHRRVNGAYLAFDVGPISFQPAEFAKIAIVIFLASYLRDTRQVLVSGARRSPASRSRR